MLLRGRKAKNLYGGTVVEIQRNGNYRVRLTNDERLCISDIKDREQAYEIDRVLSEAYHLGTTHYSHWPQSDHDDE